MSIRSRAGPVNAPLSAPGMNMRRVDGLDIASEKGQIKIRGRSDSQQIAEANRKRAVSGEIKEQIEAVGIHVGNHRQEAFTILHRPEPSVVNDGREHKLVEHPGEKAGCRVIEIVQKLPGRPRSVPVGLKAPVAIERTGRNRGKKQQEHQKGGGREFLDRSVFQANQYVDRPESQVGDAHEPD